MFHPRWTVIKEKPEPKKLQVVGVSWSDVFFIAQNYERFHEHGFHQHGLHDVKIIIYIYIISVLYTQYMEILWHVLFLQSKSHWGPLSRPAPGPREPHAPLAPRNGAPRNGALRRPRRWEKQVVFGRVATKRGPKSLKVLQIYDAL